VQKYGSLATGRSVSGLGVATELALLAAPLSIAVDGIPLATSAQLPWPSHTPCRPCGCVKWKCDRLIGISVSKIVCAIHAGNEQRANQLVNPRRCSYTLREPPSAAPWQSSSGAEPGTEPGPQLVVPKTLPSPPLDFFRAEGASWAARISPSAFRFRNGRSNPDRARIRDPRRARSPAHR
jgi:hypothetical protein